jgi:hypothetical protein
MTAPERRGSLESRDIGVEWGPHLGVHQGRVGQQGELGPDVEGNVGLSWILVLRVSRVKWGMWSSGQGAEGTPGSIGA